jgi:hypothetical protein
MSPAGLLPTMDLYFWLFVNMLCFQPFWTFNFSLTFPSILLHEGDDDGANIVIVFVAVAQRDEVLGIHPKRIWAGEAVYQGLMQNEPELWSLFLSNQAASQFPIDQKNYNLAFQNILTPNRVSSECPSKRGIWRGVAMDSLKYYQGLPCPTLLRPSFTPLDTPCVWK